MADNRHLFSVAIKSVGFAWRTNKVLFFLLIFLNIFQGAVVYLQFTSFSTIVDEIISIRQGSRTLTDLIRPSVLLGLSFLVPTMLGNLVVDRGHDAMPVRGTRRRLLRVSRR